MAVDSGLYSGFPEADTAQCEMPKSQAKTGRLFLAFPEAKELVGDVLKGNEVDKRNGQK